MEKPKKEQDKKPKNKTTIILIVAIVALLIGCLTVAYLWNSQVKELKMNRTLQDQKIEELEKQIEDLKEVNGEEISNKAIDSTRYLTIKEWGVRVQLTEDIYDSFYVLDGSNIARISTAKVAKFGDLCNPLKKNSSGEPHGGIATLSKGNGDAESGYGDGETIRNRYPIGKDIGSYYYYYTHPQAICSDREQDTEAEVKAVKSLQEAAKTVQAL